MPAPYPLLDMPPGEFSNMIDFQAINMAAAHNMFINGFNAIVYHAPTVTEDKVQPFMTFCLALLDNIHHHHDIEETYYFPAMEEKLGKGTLSKNIEQHRLFIPGLEALDEYCKKVHKGELKFDSKVFLDMINSFVDIMVNHLNCEIPTLDRNVVAQHFTAAELKAIDNGFMKRAFADIDFHKALPLAVVCANPATPWFPPLPIVLKWATKWWFSRRYSEAWKYGPTDFSGKSRLP